MTKYGLKKINLYVNMVIFVFHINFFRHAARFSAYTEILGVYPISFCYVGGRYRSCIKQAFKEMS